MLSENIFTPPSVEAEKVENRIGELMEQAEELVKEEYQGDITKEITEQEFYNTKITELLPQFYPNAFEKIENKKGMNLIRLKKLMKTDLWQGLNNGCIEKTLEELASLPMKVCSYYTCIQSPDGGVCFSPYGMTYYYDNFWMEAAPVSEILEGGKTRSIRNISKEEQIILSKTLDLIEKEYSGDN